MPVFREQEAWSDSTRMCAGPWHLGAIIGVMDRVGQYPARCGPLLVRRHPGHGFSSGPPMALATVQAIRSRVSLVVRLLPLTALSLVLVQILG